MFQLPTKDPIEKCNFKLHESVSQRLDAYVKGEAAKSESIDDTAIVEGMIVYCLDLADKAAKADKRESKPRGNGAQRPGMPPMNQGTRT